MMPSDAHVLLAYGFDGKGGATPLAEKDISRQIKARNLTWVHFDAAEPRTREWLHQEISYLDPFIIEALLADETRPRVTEIGDGAIVILRSVNLDAHADPEDMVSIRLWVDNHRIISVQLRTLKVVMDLADRLKTGHGPRSAGDFISMLIDKMFDGMEPVLSTLDERIDEMEEEVLMPAPPEALREEIANIRKQAIIFRRYMAPQREAVAEAAL
ncbi:MAG: hypothetical protein IT567_04930 [Alphaproteobacteria bacterium]|nr:hypothetical protein [Alphaproteobacteria bacterium]